MKKILYILLVFVLFIIYAISQEETQKTEKEKIEVKKDAKKPSKSTVKSRLIQPTKIQTTSITLPKYLRSLKQHTLFLVLSILLNIYSPD